MPGTGAVAEGFDRLPTQVASPATDGEPRRPAAAAQQGEADILHLVEMEQTLDTDQQREHAGQKAGRKSTHLVGQRRLGGCQPGQRRWQEEEGAGTWSRPYFLRK